MFVLTPLMVTKYDLPPELMEYTSKGNMSTTYRDMYEAALGPAFKRAVEENPEAVRILMSGPTAPKYGGWPREVQQHFEAEAAKRGLTAAEFFFGLEPGFESACERESDSSDLLGMVLLRDEPAENIRRLAEVADKRMGAKVNWGQVWRARSYGDDWFVKWVKQVLNSEHLATVIRLGYSPDDCVSFMRYEEEYIDMALRGIPLDYALACGPFDAERIQRCWEERLPAEYARALLT